MSALMRGGMLAATVSRFRMVLRPSVGLMSLLVTVSAGAQPRPAVGVEPLLADKVRFEFAVYYPEQPHEDPVLAVQRRVRGAPNAPALVEKMPDPLIKPVLRARWNAAAQASYRPPSIDLLQRFGRGLTRVQAEALTRADHALILDFAHPGARALPALRAALVLAEQVARDTGGLLWDEETREVFTPDEWHRLRLDTWVGELPPVSRHTVIHAYQNGDGVRAITLGMLKFGLPDLVFNDAPWSDSAAVGNLINLLGQALLEGARVSRPGEFDLDPRALRQVAMRDALLPALNPTAKVALLSLRQAKPEEGDPENRLIEIGADRYAGTELRARQMALLGSLFDRADGVVAVRHDDELLAASKAAVARLPTLRQTFQRGLPPGEYLLVKAPFPTKSRGHEWMWVEVMRWEGSAITGMLKSEPRDVPQLRTGQTVQVLQSEVFDYIWHHADGSHEGNTTGAIIERMQSASRTSNR